MNEQIRTTAGNQIMIDPITTEATEQDNAAIVKLNQDFATVKAAFIKDQYPSLDTRIERIRRIQGMFMKYRSEMHSATGTKQVLGMVFGES